MAFSARTSAQAPRSAGPAPPAGARRPRTTSAAPRLRARGTRRARGRGRRSARPPRPRRTRRGPRARRSSLAAGCCRRPPRAPGVARARARIRSAHPRGDRGDRTSSPPPSRDRRASRRFSRWRSPPRPEEPAAPPLKDSRASSPMRLRAQPSIGTSLPAPPRSSARRRTQRPARHRRRRSSRGSRATGLAGVRGRRRPRRRRPDAPRGTPRTRRRVEVFPAMDVGAGEVGDPDRELDPVPHEVEEPALVRGVRDALRHDLRAVGAGVREQEQERVLVEAPEHVGVPGRREEDRAELAQGVVRRLALEAEHRARERRVESDARA